MTATLPTLDELLETATSPSTFLAATYASGWLVRQTVAPAWTRSFLTAVLVLAPVAAVVLLARAAGISLERGQCRARTDDGDRCTRDAAGVSADLCWQHQRLHDVELVDAPTPDDPDEQHPT